jgi:hypothetical protein
MPSELLKNLMSVPQVARTFQKAMEEKEAISLVNLGDGEIIFIAYQRLPGFDKWPSPSGIDPYFKFVSDQSIRDALVEGVVHSQIVAMPAYLYTGNWPAAEKVLEHFSIPTSRICDSNMGRLLHSAGLLYEILENKRVYLVGNHILNLLPILEKHHIEMAGHTTVDFFEDIPRVKAEISKADFDMALLSAGMPTLILAPWIKETLNRCALDFGSAIHHLD